MNPIQRVQLAFEAAQEYLGVSGSSIDPLKLVSGQQDHQLKKYLQNFRYYYNQHESSRTKQSKPLQRQRSLQYGEDPGSWNPRAPLHGNRPLPGNQSSPLTRQGANTLRHSTSNLYHMTPGSTQTLQRYHHHARNHAQQQKLSSSTEHINTIVDTPQTNIDTPQTNIDTHSQAEQGSRGYRNNRFNKQKASSVDHSTTGLNYSLYSSGKLTKDASMHGRPYHPNPYNQSRQIEKFRQSDKSPSDHLLSGRHSVGGPPEKLYSGDVPPSVTIYRTSSRTSVHSTSSMERNGNEEHSFTPGLSHHALSKEKYSSLSDLSRNMDLSDITSDQFSHHIEDLNERISHLVALMSDEKTELIQKLRMEGEYIFLTPKFSEKMFDIFSPPGGHCIAFLPCIN